MPGGKDEYTWYGAANLATASIHGVQASVNPVSLVLAFAGTFVSHPGKPPAAENHDYCTGRPKLMIPYWFLPVQAVNVV